MLKYRLIFGPIMIAFMLALFYIDERLERVDLAGTWIASWTGWAHPPGGLLLLVVIMALIVLGARELCVIFRAVGVEPDRMVVTLAGLVGCLMMYVMPTGLSSRTTLAVFASMFVGVFILALLKNNWARRQTRGAVLGASVVLFAMVYMGLLPGFLLAIRRQHSAWIVLGVLLVVKSCDIGAYFTGRAIGRHKLIPWLSPGKTREGLAGGMLFSAVVAVALVAANNHFGFAGVYLGQGEERVFHPQVFSLVWAAVAGLFFGGLGQFGDLIASMFKRDAGIKDSGSTIPGFGGILDVVDSPIIVAPFAWWLLEQAAVE